MLKKLMKHEFLASYRFHVTLYISILIMALISSLSFQYDQLVFGGLVFGLMALMIGAMGVFTLYNIVISMYQRVFGKPGYLLFSIPASTVQIMASKVLVNIIWLSCTGLVTLSSLFLFVRIAAPMGFIEEITREILEFVQFTPYDIFVLVVYGIVLVIYQIGFFQFLFALLNHIYKGEKKLMMGILLYFGVNYAITFVITLLTGTFSTQILLENPVFTFDSLWVSIGIYFAVASGLYYASYVFIEKKLELQ